VPAHPDPHGLRVGFGQPGDVGDQGAQQAFAVAGMASACQSRGRSAASDRSESVAGSGGLVALAVASAASALASAAILVSQRDSKCSCHKTVFRFDVTERALRAVGVVAGALHRQFRRAVGAGVPVDDLFPGGWQNRLPRRGAPGTAPAG
jgi:hypothetical protein